MLIRFVVKNFFSFGDEKEFNMIPNTRLKTLDNHKYHLGNFELLKMASIYGANGSGKSNLVKSLIALKRMVHNGELPQSLKNGHFKFQKDASDSIQLLAIEFFQDDIAYYYAVQIKKGIVITEELYRSGLGKKQDELIYERKTDLNSVTNIIFSNEAEQSEKIKIFKSVLIEDFVKPGETILKLISNRENEFLKDAKKAYAWFRESLSIITPRAAPTALANRIEIDSEFRDHAQEIMCAFNVGIVGLNSEKKNIKELIGAASATDLDSIIKSVDDSPKNMVGLKSSRGDEIIVVKEDEDYFVKQLILTHKGKDDIACNFSLEEESDGTIRLLHLIPAFQDVVIKRKVFIIDEVERSIHPLLIKELIKKFSLDDNSLGQLIFTTHESNLLDQEIFRQDEIWFTEKDKNGITDLYSLSDFKEHKTIDIRKGYLNGRYGSIPFLANLQDLNWHTYDTDQ